MLKKKKQEQPKMTLTQASGFSQGINLEEVAKDVDALIAKYYQGAPMNVLHDAPASDKGFFLLFINRDATRKDGDLGVRTFGANMTIGQLLQAFEEVMRQIFENSKNGKIPTA